MADLEKEYDRVSNSEEMNQLIRTLSKCSGVGEEVLDEDLSKLETRLKEIEGGVADAVSDLDKLPGNPKSFDDILAIVEPERTKKVKNFRFELNQLQERRDNITQEHEGISKVKKYQDRLFDLVDKERKVKAAVKSLENENNKRITMAAFVFKNGINQFIQEYWDEAKVTRKVLDRAQKACGRRTRDLDAENAQKLMAVAIKERAAVEKVEKKVIKLSRLGNFIGKMRAEQAKDIKFDSLDMKKLYETAITKLNKRIQQLKSAADEMKKKEEQQKLKQYDDEHKKEYNILFEWSDMKLHEVNGFGQEVRRLVRSPRKSKKKEKRLNTIEETLKNLYEVDLPVKDQAVADGMSNISSLLEDKQYARLGRVKEREDKVRSSLKELSAKVVREIQKVKVLREGGDIQESPRKSLRKRASQKKLEVQQIEENKSQPKANKGVVEESNSLQQEIQEEKEPEKKKDAMKEAIRDLEQWTNDQAEKTAPSKSAPPLSPDKFQREEKTSPKKEEMKVSKLVRRASAPMKKETLTQKEVKPFKANKERNSIEKIPPTVVEGIQFIANEENIGQSPGATESSVSVASEERFHLAVSHSVSFPPGIFEKLTSTESLRSLKQYHSNGQLEHLQNELVRLQSELGDLHRQVKKLEDEKAFLVDEKNILEMEGKSLLAMRTVAVSNGL